MERAEIEAKLAAFTERRRLTEQRLQELADRLAEIEEERGALLGEIALGRRAIADYEEAVDRLQGELIEAARKDEALAALHQAIEVRDSALEEASVAIEQVAAAFGRVDAARDAVVAAHRHVRSVDANAAPGLPPEPVDFRERWSTVAPLVEQELGRRLDSELVEAAVRSSNYLAVESLPEHLREFAQQRWRDSRKRPRERSRG